MDSGEPGCPIVSIPVDNGPRVTSLIETFVSFGAFHGRLAISSLRSAIVASPSPQALS